MFSDSVRTEFEASGWTPDRKVFIEDWVKLLESEGFTILPEGHELLQSFGGLVVRPVKSSSDLFTPNIIQFDPVMAASGEFDRVDYWQQRLNIKLTPLAELGAGDILLISEDGRVFSCWNQQLFLDGSTFEGALENTLIHGRRMPVEIGKMID